MICLHYKKNKENRYVNMISKKGPHIYICRRCKCKLHDADVDRLNKHIHNLNGDYKNIIELGDKYCMESPVPTEYWKDYQCDKVDHKYNKPKEDEIPVRFKDDFFIDYEII